MPAVFREGSVTVTLDDGLERLARAAAEHVQPGVLSEMEAAVGSVLDDAKAAWPVRSGLSSRALHVRVDFSDAAVEVRIVPGGVKYTGYVRPKDWYGAETAWSRLIQKPMRLLHRELVGRLGARVLEGLRRG